MRTDGAVETDSGVHHELAPLPAHKTELARLNRLEDAEEQKREQIELHEVLARDVERASACLDFEAIDRLAPDGTAFMTPALRARAHELFEALLAYRQRVLNAIVHYREEHASLADQLHAEEENHG